MLSSIIWLIVGLVIILVGANTLTDGSSAIASRLGVSDFVIGLTVVAMGTSAPELVVSVTAAIDGSAPLAIGNVVGSNIFNILVILGATALVKPIDIERSVLSTEIPIVVLSSIALLVLGNSTFINGDSINEITRVDGIFLLIVFILYMRHTLKSGKAEECTPAADNSQKAIDCENTPQVKRMPMWKAVGLAIFGLGALIYGGDRFVDGASGLASALGMSEALIGLTIVAAGTSLPELATSIVAAIKGKGALAVGNVIGSCIFNVFFVLGAASTVHMLPFGDVNNTDLFALVAASVLFWLVGKLIGTRIITRGEGMAMLALYVVYIVVKILSL